MPNYSDISRFPEIDYTEQHELTRPMPLHELPKQVRIDHEMALVRAQHERIAKIIEVLWGHPECMDYIKQLVFDGGDGVDKSRVGFKREVLSALLNLSHLHEIEHKAPPESTG